MKYWEIIADNLSRAGWSWGCVSTVDSYRRTIFIGDAMAVEAGSTGKMKDGYAQTVLLMWKSVTLVCDAAVKLNKFLFADSKLRCVADCCITAVVIVEVVRRACCAKAVGVILYKLT